MRLVILMSLVLSLGCAGAEPPKTPPPREIEVLTLAPTTVRDTAEYLGSLISRQSVTVVPQVAGYVRHIAVRPGQRVNAGDTLLEVDGRQEAAALESAEAQKSSAQSSAELAAQTLKRTQALYQEGLVSAQELDRAKASADAADAATKQAGAQVSQRKVQLQYYAVRAPFDGTVGDVIVRVGDFVSATTPLTSVAEADVLEVSVGVPAERARMVTTATPLEILDGGGSVAVTAPVYFVAPQADPRTQLVDVKAAFRNNGGLRPSELVRARLVYNVRQALQVPALAVVRQSGQSFVFLLQQKDGKTVVARHPVTLGVLGEQSYVVEQGLSDGAQVAVSSIQALRDGALVVAKPAATAPSAEKGESAK